MTINITCLVENSVQLSSPLWGEHGISVLIEEPDKTTLFDTGQSGEVLLHNMEKLGIDPHKIDQIVLSHGHYDHTGGLKDLLQKIGMRPVHGHPDIFCDRFSERPDGSLKPVRPPFDKEDIKAEWHLSPDFIQVTDRVFTTGQIERVESLEEHGDERLKIRDPQNPDKTIKDPIRDDMSLVVKSSKGLVVLLGCCHAGVLNTLKQIKKQFPNETIHAIMGGTHLAKASEARLQKTEEAVETIERIGLSHCTSLPVTARFISRFPQQAFVFQAGSRLEF